MHEADDSFTGDVPPLDSEEVYGSMLQLIKEERPTGRGTGWPVTYSMRPRLTLGRLRNVLRTLKAQKLPALLDG